MRVYASSGETRDAFTSSAGYIDSKYSSVGPVQIDDKSWIIGLIYDEDSTLSSSADIIQIDIPTGEMYSFTFAAFDYIDDFLMYTQSTSYTSFFWLSRGSESQTATSVANTVYLMYINITSTTHEANIIWVKTFVAASTTPNMSSYDNSLLQINSYLYAFFSIDDGDYIYAVSRGSGSTMMAVRINSNTYIETAMVVKYSSSKQTK